MLIMLMRTLYEQHLKSIEDYKVFLILFLIFKYMFTYFKL
jgi:hypothetical protein